MTIKDYANSEGSGAQQYEERGTDGADKAAPTTAVTAAPALQSGARVGLWGQRGLANHRYGRNY